MIVTSNIILVEKNSPNHPSPQAELLSDLYGVTLRTLLQVCFQGWGVFKGDPGRPLNHNIILYAQDHAAVFSYHPRILLLILLSWNRGYRWNVELSHDCDIKHTCIVKKNISRNGIIIAGYNEGYINGKIEKNLTPSSLRPSEL